MPIILVVDDDAVDRELAERCLEGLDNLEVLFAESGRQALELLAQRQPDLVLTDLRMPGMDGIELVGKIHEPYPRMPVVLMTSKGSEQAAVQALAAGAASYVPKADLAEHLVETVQQVLEVEEGRRSRDQLLGYLDSKETRFVLDNDVKLISPLAGYFQSGLERLGFGNESLRTQVGMAIMEALSNAVIHGNLDVGSELRTESTKAYYDLIEKRRGEKPWSERRVYCTARESVSRIEYVIRDEGDGFDHASLPDPTLPENLVRVRGRGLMLIHTFMDEVRFNDKGNEITLSKDAPAPSDASPDDAPEER
jgi:CheY-like chemotaxis protein/anti-sigma regulatory factor (Ser/Thr protein kinase)